MNEKTILNLKDNNNYKQFSFFIKSRVNKFVTDLVYLAIKFNLNKDFKKGYIIDLINSNEFKKDGLDKLYKELYKIRHSQLSKEEIKTIKDLIKQASNEEIMEIISEKLDYVIKYYTTKLINGTITKESCAKFNYKKRGRDRAKTISSYLCTIKGIITKINMTKAMLKVINSNIVKINKDGTNRKILTGTNISKYFKDIKIDMINKNVVHYNNFIANTLFDEETSDKEKVLLYSRCLKDDLKHYNSLIKQIRKVFKIIPFSDKEINPLEINFVPALNNLGKKRKPYRKSFKSLRETIVHLRAA